MVPFLIITGPTAVGKTELSLRLAERLGAEIISADSRQVYKRLDIGTAKPSIEDLARVRHHFIDELELGEPFSAGAFQDSANRRIDAIAGRGTTPLIVGGSTLYIHALKHGFANIPSVAPEIRQRIEIRLQERGASALYENLKHVDPAAAASMDPTKTQRLIRALEVYEATGRPLSSYYENQPPPRHDFKTIVLNRDRRNLYDRINRRVDAMLKAGLLDEVAGLLSTGYDPELNPLRTIGYQEPIRYLQGEISHKEMVRLVKRNSRRYAKRQLTWFRRDPDNCWLEAELPMAELISSVQDTAIRS